MIQWKMKCKPIFWPTFCIYFIQIINILHVFRERVNVNIHNEYKLIQESLKEFVDNVSCRVRINSLGKFI